MTSPNPAPTIHPSHVPESLDERIVPGATYCKVCCRLIEARNGVRARGRDECAGPARLDLRNGQTVLVRGEINDVGS